MDMQTRKKHSYGKSSHIGEKVIAFVENNKLVSFKNESLTLILLDFSNCYQVFTMDI